MLPYRTSRPRSGRGLICAPESMHRGWTPLPLRLNPIFPGCVWISDDFLGVNISPVASWYIVSTKLFDQLSQFATFPCVAFAPSILCHCSSFPHLNCRRIRQEPEPPPPPRKVRRYCHFSFSFSATHLNLFPRPTHHSATRRKTCDSSFKVQAPHQTRSDNIFCLVGLRFSGVSVSHPKLPLHSGAPCFDRYLTWLP